MRSTSPLALASVISAMVFLALVAAHASAAAQPKSASPDPATVDVTLSYMLIGGGPFSPPTLWYTLGGANHTTTLSTTPTAYVMDNGGSWGTTRILPGSTTSEQGAAQYGTFTGNADGQTVVIVYYRQYYADFGVPRASNLTSYSLPIVTYLSLGFPSTATAGSSVWADYLSPYNYSNVVGLPANIRYSIIDPTGVVQSQALIVPPYTEQYLIDFQLSSTGPDLLPSANFTAKFDGAPLTRALIPPGGADWIDANSSITFQRTVGSGSNRWIMHSASVVTAYAPATAMVVYFDQYPLTVSYSISSGSAPSGTVLDYVYNGQDLTLELYPGAPPTWVDARSEYTLSTILQGSTSLERWIATSGTNGFMSSQRTVNLLYYHQAWVTLGYSVVGGGSIGPFDATFVNFGARNSTLVSGTQTGIWIDFGTTLSVPGNFSGGSASERWELGTSPSTLVQGPQSIPLVYYHQFDVPVRYTVVGGGSPAPALTGVSFGSSFTEPIGPTAALWLDSGTRYSLPQILPGGETGERWYDAAGFSGVVGANSSLAVSYQHQFLVTLTGSSQGAGSVSGPGWVASGGSAQIFTSVNGGWMFAGWTGTGPGSYSGPDLNASVTASGPVQETANFYVGVGIQVVGRGSLLVSFGSSSYTIAGTTTFYLPPGTNITLVTKPDPFETFSGWQGIPAGSAAAVEYTLVSPVGIIATFTINEVEVLGIAVLCFGAVAYAVAYLVWKNRVSPGSILRRQVGRGEEAV